jgi:hypothetical protein
MNIASTFPPSQERARSPSRTRCNRVGTGSSAPPCELLSRSSFDFPRALEVTVVCCQSDNRASIRSNDKRLLLHRTKWTIALQVLVVDRRPASELRDGVLSIGHLLLMTAASTKRFIVAINGIYKAFEQNVTGVTALFATFILEMHHDISPQRGKDMATKLRFIFAAVLVMAAFIAINSWAAGKHDAAGHIAAAGSYRAGLWNAY